jgi:3-phosphoshikimate 1-carboxyvinyltransferase
MSEAGQQAVRYLVEPAPRVEGEITVPGDKSISHRALMLGGIARGRTEITGFLAGEDCLATLRALADLGVRIERPAPSHVIVHGEGPEGLSAAAQPLDMGNAGTAIRLSMGLLSGQGFDSTLIGDASLMRRPMERVATPLRLMGARIETADGKPPVQVRASTGLTAIDYTLPVASAQVKSAVLLAALAARGRTRVVEPAPTRDHTERMLTAFGATVWRAGTADRVGRPEVALEGGQPLTGTAVQVPGDFSSAAFFLVAGLLAADRGLLLRNVGINPTRTGLLTLLKQMGADIRVLEARRPLPHPDAEKIADIEVRRSELRGITVPQELVPLSIDEFPVFFIAASCASGTTVLRGAQELRVKESDRLGGMAAGLTALGVRNELLPDGIRIEGGEGFSGGTVDSLGDHRIAMAFAVASLKARAPIEILDVANVATSFPGFLEMARRTGMTIEQL